MTDPDPADQPEDESRTAVSSLRDVPWTFGDALLVMLLWFFFLVALVGLIVFPALQALLPQATAEAAVLPVSTGLLIVVTTTYVGLRYPRQLRRLFGPAPPTWRAVGYGLAAGVVGLVVFGVVLGNLLELLARLVDFELPQVQEQFQEIAAEPEGAPMLILGSVLVAPVAEELFYRGMMFTALRRLLPLWPSMGVSGGLFGLSHFQTGGVEATLLVLLIIMPLGMLFAWVYERRGTLVVPIVAHAVFNLVQVAFLVQRGGAV